MRGSRTNRPFANSAQANVIEDALPLDGAYSPDGANAPQDSQDFQDSHDSKDTKDIQRHATSSAPLQNVETVLHLPLAEYVRIVIDHLKPWEDTPLSDRWRSPLFDFARLCKAHPAITDLQDDDAMRTVHKVMCGWGELRKHEDPWEFYFPGAESSDSARLDFMASWVSVRHVPFRDVVSNAARLAEETPVQPPHERGELYERFVSLAAWLQVLLPNREIYLPTRKIADQLSCDQRTVSRLRKLAIQDGLLTTLKPHRFLPSGKSEATAFRFAIERYPTLEGQ